MIKEWLMLKPAIVVVGYNRADSMSRLLKSIGDARYDYKDINLIISIDYCENNQDVLKVAESFVWEYGEKCIRYHKKNMGLRKHILSCGDLTEKYGSVIVLEDDLIVSPYFYDFAVKALDFCNDLDYVAGISLYKNDYNQTAAKKFCELDDGYDNWYLKQAQSWGQAWSFEQWGKFKQWYENNVDTPFDDKNIPENIRNWSASSWLKYYDRYVIETNKYYFYPRVSYTTNNTEPGTHFQSVDHTFQVPLAYGKKEFDFSKIEESGSVYDAFYENENLHKWMGFDNNELTVDLYGTKEVVNTRYLLSSRKLDYEIVKSYACSMRPMEMSVMYNIKGNNFYLYDTDKKIKNTNTVQNVDLTYFYPGLRLESEYLITKRFVKHLFKSHKMKNIKVVLKRILNRR